MFWKWCVVMFEKFHYSHEFGQLDYIHIIPTMKAFSIIFPRKHGISKTSRAATPLDHSVYIALPSIPRALVLQAWSTGGFGGAAAHAQGIAVLPRTVPRPKGSGNVSSVASGKMSKPIDTTGLLRIVRHLLQTGSPIAVLIETH